MRSTYLDHRYGVRHADYVRVRELLRWKPRTRGQVIADRVANVAVAWLVVGVWAATVGDVGHAVAFGITWTVVMLGVGVPIGLRQLNRRER